MGRFGWIVVLLVVAGAVFWWRGGGKATPIAQAVAQSRVNTTISAADATEARITISRGAMAKGALNLVIPAGTLIHSPVEGGQRLMTATAVTVRLGADEPSKTVTVETYCLDQFGLQPTSADSLSFDPSASEDATDGTGPARDLVDCLAPSKATHAARQFAVWMVAGGYLDRSQDDARDAIRRAYRETLGTEARAMMRGPARDRLAQAMPGLTSSQLDDAVDRYVQRRLGAKLDARAEKMTADDLAAFGSADVRAALDACGHKTADLPFFRI